MSSPSTPAGPFSSPISPVEISTSLEPHPAFVLMGIALAMVAGPVLIVAIQIGLAILHISRHGLI